MKGCLNEFELAKWLTVQDVDREIAFLLLSLARQFDRWEIDQVVAYVIRADEAEVGRLVIAPGTGAGGQVRIREHHTLLEQGERDSPRPAGKSHLHAEFATLCRHLRKSLESIQHAEGSAEVEMSRHQSRPAPDHTNGTNRDSDHFAYPRNKRREIVQHYRLDRVCGEVRNKDRWARQHYQISGRTLFNYECEFPPMEESGLASARNGPVGLS